VEHFFTRWLAIGVGAETHLLDYKKQGDPWTMDVTLSNTTYMASLFVYTD
jgi:hypothetical protein